ncbi:MAG: N-acetyltransferase [Gordonia sp. (in: high G+C Gram-positive bacteria)]
MWDRRAVVAASTAWTSSWHPDGSRHLVENGHEMYLIDREATLLGYHGAIADPAAVLEEAERIALANGARTLRITVGIGTFGALDAAALNRRGATTVAVIDVLAAEITAAAIAAIPVPPTAVTHRVRTEDELAEYAATARRAWGFTPPALADPDFVLDRPAARLFTVRVGGDPAGSAGYELAADVARLWGAAVVPDHRGSGAYRSLIAARMADAAGLGATLALVHAEQTSSPILRRLGFAEYAHRRLTAIGLTGR